MKSKKIPDLEGMKKAVEAIARVNVQEAAMDATFAYNVVIDAMTVARDRLIAIVAADDDPANIIESHVREVGYSTNDAIFSIHDVKLQCFMLKKFAAKYNKIKMRGFTK